MLHELVLKEIDHRKQGDPNLPHVDEQQSFLHSMTRKYYVFTDCNGLQSGKECLLTRCFLIGTLLALPFLSSA